MIISGKKGEVVFVFVFVFFTKLLPAPPQPASTQKVLGGLCKGGKGAFELGI